MHDFIQLQSFRPDSNPRAAIHHVVPEWVQRGLMRSFGEDNFVAAYRPSPRESARSRPKAKAAPRSAILPGPNHS